MHIYINDGFVCPNGHTYTDKARGCCHHRHQLICQLPLCSQSGIRAGGMAFVVTWCGFVVVLVILWVLFYLYVHLLAFQETGFTLLSGSTLSNRACALLPDANAKLSLSLSLRLASSLALMSLYNSVGRCKYVWCSFRIRSYKYLMFEHFVYSYYVYLDKGQIVTEIRREYCR